MLPFLSFLLASLALGAPISPKTPVAPAARVPVLVLVELFTSEGCSSCPSADRTLSELEATQPVAGAEIIALSLHVDYWNRLGWADPYSSAAYSNRQRRYASALHSSQVYTPQMVVDGDEAFVGSQGATARQKIAAAAARPKATVSLTTTTGASGSVEVHLRVSALPAGTSGADVLLAVTENGLTTAVPRGENAGHTLPHRAVVRTLTAVGSVADSGFDRTVTVKIDPSWQRDKLRLVAFVQAKGEGRVVGVGTSAL